jgi:hypothetical protein
MEGIFTKILFVWGRNQKSLAEPFLVCKAFFCVLLMEHPDSFGRGAVLDCLLTSETCRIVCCAL